MAEPIEARSLQVQDADGAPLRPLIGIDGDMMPASRILVRLANEECGQTIRHLDFQGSGEFFPEDQIVEELPCLLWCCHRKWIDAVTAGIVDGSRRVNLIKQLIHGADLGSLSVSFRHEARAGRACRGDRPEPGRPANSPPTAPLGTARGHPCRRWRGPPVAGPYNASEATVKLCWEHLLGLIMHEPENFRAGDRLRYTD